MTIVPRTMSQAVRCRSAKKSMAKLVRNHASMIKTNMAATSGDASVLMTRKDTTASTTTPFIKNSRSAIDPQLTQRLVDTSITLKPSNCLAGDCPLS